MIVVNELVELLRGKRVVALTGAGCSTESGIPDYRGPDAKPRTPIQHREFVDKPDARKRYWARSLLGWPRLKAARPNPAHRALAAMEETGKLSGVITQNVDGLHAAAGSRAVVELHGAIARVRCLACEVVVSRDVVQQRLLAANPSWRGLLDDTRVDVGDAELPPRPQGDGAAPDGDFELGGDRIASFEVVACDCGGVLMPDVVFFGGSVPKPTLDAAWSTFDRAEVLLVVGSSLAVFSGYRFVRRAAERGVPVAILNRGPTRGDPHAALRIDARVGELLPALARALA